jgi:hypothetical protein
MNTKEMIKWVKDVETYGYQPHECDPEIIVAIIKSLQHYETLLKVHDFSEDDLKMCEIILKDILDPTK